LDIDVLFNRYQRPLLRVAVGIALAHQDHVEGLASSPLQA
jgi:hypothetical protein